MPVVCALGRLCVTRYLAPRGVQGHVMGLCNDGDDPAALAHARSPGASVDGSDQDLVALVVSGGAGIEALRHVVGVYTSDVAGPVSTIETSGAHVQSGGYRPEEAAKTKCA